MIFLSFITRPALNALGYGPLASWVTVKEALVVARMAAPFGRPMAYVDEYLNAWLYATRVENRIIGALSKEEHDCQSHLAKALRRGDLGAIPRLVLLMVVQVGGSVSASSDLGIELRKVLGTDFPLSKLDDGPSYFASDLCLWYLKHRDQYPAFVLMDEWLKSEFATQTVIPGYENMVRT
jgi:hypothetical protein